MLMFIGTKIIQDPFCLQLVEVNLGLRWVRKSISENHKEITYAHELN